MCLQRLDSGNDNLKMNLGKPIGVVASQETCVRSGNVISPKKTIGTASTVVLSPRQFRSALRVSHEESKALTDSNYQDELLTAQTIVGRPFHRSKLLSKDATSSDSSNSSSSSSQLSDKSDHISSSRDSSHQEPICTSDLQSKAILSLQRSTTESNLVEVTVDNSIEITSDKCIDQNCQNGRITSHHTQLLIMNFKQKIDLTLALSEVMQLEGNAMEAANIMVKLLNDIVVGRDSLPSLESSATLSGVANSVACGDKSSSSTFHSQWNVLLSVCHRRLGYVIILVLIRMVVLSRVCLIILFSAFLWFF